jgi:DNA-binding transcriptional ArsR family regulator
MAKSGERPKAKKSAGKGRRANGAKPYEEDDLIKALNHALRRQALRLLHASRKPLSPAQIEAKLELGEAPKDQLSQVSYHVKVLVRLKVISLVDEQQVRGAMEHFYTSEVSSNAWVRNSLKRTQKSDEAQLWPKGRRGGKG